MERETDHYRGRGKYMFSFLDIHFEDYDCEFLHLSKIIYKVEEIQNILLGFLEVDSFQQNLKTEGPWEKVKLHNEPLSKPTPVNQGSYTFFYQIFSMTFP